MLEENKKNRNRIKKSLSWSNFTSVLYKYKSETLAKKVRRKKNKNVKRRLKKKSVFGITTVLKTISNFFKKIQSLFNFKKYKPSKKNSLDQIKVNHIVDHKPKNIYTDDHENQILEEDLSLQITWKSLNSTDEDSGLLNELLNVDSDLLESNSISDSDTVVSIENTEVREKEVTILGDVFEDDSYDEIDEIFDDFYNDLDFVDKNSKSEIENQTPGKRLRFLSGLSGNSNISDQDHKHEPRMYNIFPTNNQNSNDTKKSIINDTIADHKPTLEEITAVKKSRKISGVGLNKTNFKKRSLLKNKSSGQCTGSFENVTMPENGKSNDPKKPIINDAIADHKPTLEEIGAIGKFNGTRLKNKSFGRCTGSFENVTVPENGKSNDPKKPIINDAIADHKPTLEEIGAIEKFNGTSLNKTSFKKRSLLKNKSFGQCTASFKNLSVNGSNFGEVLPQTNKKVAKSVSETTLKTNLDTSNEATENVANSKISSEYKNSNLVARKKDTKTGRIKKASIRSTGSSGSF